MTKKEKFISKTEEKPLNTIGEANISTGDYWIVEEEEEETQEIKLLKEIRDLLKIK